MYIDLGVYMYVICMLMFVFKILDWHSLPGNIDVKQ